MTSKKLHQLFKERLSAFYLQKYGTPCNARIIAAAWFRIVVPVLDKNFPAYEGLTPGEAAIFIKAAATTAMDEMPEIEKAAGLELEAK